MKLCQFATARVCNYLMIDIGFFVEKILVGVFVLLFLLGAGFIFGGWMVWNYKMAQNWYWIKHFHLCISFLQQVSFAEHDFCFFVGEKTLCTLLLSVL